MHERAVAGALGVGAGAAHAAGAGNAVGAADAVGSNPSLQGFAPILDACARTLILGSFPSAASLAAGQYYAHPRNQFWRILGAVLGEPLAELDYATRTARLRAHRIGLWDVYGACDRAGSLDSAIRNQRANDFGLLRRRAPRLGRVLFNGATAGRCAPVFAAAGFDTVVMPSTSPAYAGRSVEEKLAAWRLGLSLGSAD